MLGVLQRPSLKHESMNGIGMQVKSLAVENSGMQARMQSALEEQKRRALEAVRAAERSRARMLCEKAAAEHDLVQVPTLSADCNLRCSLHQFLS